MRPSDQAIDRVHERDAGKSIESENPATKVVGSHGAIIHNAGVFVDGTRLAVHQDIRKENSGRGSIENSQRRRECSPPIGKRNQPQRCIGRAIEDDLPSKTPVASGIHEMGVPSHSFKPDNKTVLNVVYHSNTVAVVCVWRDHVVLEIGSDRISDWVEYTIVVVAAAVLVAPGNIAPVRMAKVVVLVASIDNTIFLALLTNERLAIVPIRFSRMVGIKLADMLYEAQHGWKVFPRRIRLSTLLRENYDLFVVCRGEESLKVKRLLSHSTRLNIVPPCTSAYDCP